MDLSDSFVRNCIFSDFFSFVRRFFCGKIIIFQLQFYIQPLNGRVFLLGFLFVCFVVVDVFNIQLFAVL